MPRRPRDRSDWGDKAIEVIRERNAAIGAVRATLCPLPHVTPEAQAVLDAAENWYQSKPTTWPHVELNAAVRAWRKSREGK